MGITPSNVDAGTAAAIADAVDLTKATFQEGKTLRNLAKFAPF